MHSHNICLACYSGYQTFYHSHSLVQIYLLCSCSNTPNPSTHSPKPQPISLGREWTLVAVNRSLWFAVSPHLVAAVLLLTVSTLSWSRDEPQPLSSLPVTLDLIGCIIWTLDQTLSSIRWRVFCCVILELVDYSLIFVLRNTILYFIVFTFVHWHCCDLQLLFSCFSFLLMCCSSFYFCQYHEWW